MMIVLNMRDGKTRKFDMDSDREEFNRLGSDTAEISNVSGIWLNSGDQCTTLPFPRKFRRVYFYCLALKAKARDQHEERVTGDQIVVQADNIRLIVTSYRSRDRMTRIDLRNTGKQIYSPMGA